jgi:3-isopropylmalate/(R)-2-methylmalate dehydratase large subunit
MAQKVLARHSGKSDIAAGDIVVCDVDRIIMTDVIFPRTPERLPTDILHVEHPERITVLFDHGAPAPTVESTVWQARGRAFAKQFGIDISDIGRQGIQGHVIIERALALPGQLLLCNDSHTVAGGAVNCAARGLGVADILQAVCTGQTWYRASAAVKFVLEGELPPGTYGKDIFLDIAGRFGSVEGLDVEFAGAGLGPLSLDDRATLATMCAEISANFAMMPADQKILDFLAATTTAEFEPAEADPDAVYERVEHVDLTKIRPSVAKPGFIPRNVVDVDAVGDGERISIDQAFIGSCANGKLSDLRVAADIVRGHEVAPGTRLIVTPASQQVYLDAVKLGYVEALVTAGAVVTNSTCGACFGGHMGIVGPNEVCITSSPRNFRGRMGHPSAQVYVASSATVAASALAGYITNPQSYISDPTKTETKTETEAS